MSVSWDPHSGWEEQGRRKEPRLQSCPLTFPHGPCMETHVWVFLSCHFHSLTLLCKSQAPSTPASTYPVQGICVECVVSIPPFRVTGSLKANFLDRENITLSLLFLSYLRDSRGVRMRLSTLLPPLSPVFSSHPGLVHRRPEDTPPTHLILRIVTVQYKGLLAITLCNFNHKIGS